MKILATIALSAILLAGCGVPRSVRGTYDLGSCSPNGYIAIAVDIKSKKIVLTDFSSGPHSIYHLDEQVVFDYKSSSGGEYVFESKDKEGIVYVLKLRFKNDRVAGYMFVDGRKSDVVYGGHGDADSLLKIGKQAYVLCVDMNTSTGDGEQFINEFLNGGPVLNGVQQ
jgi:hypothetical protein